MWIRELSSVPYKRQLLGHLREAYKISKVWGMVGWGSLLRVNHSPRKESHVGTALRKKFEPRIGVWKTPGKGISRDTGCCIGRGLGKKRKWVRVLGRGPNCLGFLGPKSRGWICILSVLYSQSAILTRCCQRKEEETHCSPRILVMEIKKRVEDYCLQQNRSLGKSLYLWQKINVDVLLWWICKA